MFRKKSKHSRAQYREKNVDTSFLKEEKKKTLCLEVCSYEYGS